MAFGKDTISGAAGAVSDIFAGFGHEAKAEGDRLEGQNYDKAAGLADLNANYTAESTGIKQMQLDRSIYKSVSGTQADVAGAGLAQSGSALDILSESAREGALAKQVLGRQGAITEAGYKEQGESFRIMSEAANKAADAEDTAAIGSDISGAIKGISAVASLFML